MNTPSGVRESRVILAADAVACERYALPVVEKGKGREPPVLTPLTASQLEALQRAAYDEAFERGRAEGDKRGHDEGTARAQKEQAPMLANLRNMLGQLATPLARLDDEVEDNLIALAFACARQIVRRELRTDPGEVVAAVREALAALPIASRELRIHLNRTDIERVREVLGSDTEEAPWRLLEDPAMSPGGCRVESEFSRVDASVESRLNAIFAQVLGGDRSRDGMDGEHG